MDTPERGLPLGGIWQSEHFLRTGCVVVPDALAARLWRLAHLEDARAHASGTDPALYELLNAVAMSANRHRRVSAVDRDSPSAAEMGGRSAMTTQQAAGRLGVTTRTIRNMLADGTLIGTQLDENRQWLIDPDSVARLAHTRQDRR